MNVLTIPRRAKRKFSEFVLPGRPLRQLKQRALARPFDSTYPFDVAFKLLPHLVKSNAICFDVGANTGLYTCFMCDFTAPENIYSFEPFLQSYRMLRRRFKKAHVFDLALSDKGGSAVLRVPEVNGHFYSTRATLEHGVVEPGQGASIPQHVKTTTLDQFISEHGVTSMGFIKIDVEGHELNVIRGAGETLRSFRPVMLIEIEQRHHGFPMSTIVEEIESLSYRGHFVRVDACRLCPVKEFDVVRDQDFNHHKTNKYINNFIFVPAEEETRITEEINELLRGCSAPLEQNVASRSQR